jgi:uncharacterized RDD family membrane protein YckC
MSYSSQPASTGTPITRYNVDGVLWRRVLALAIDLVLVTLLVCILYVVLILSTFGLALLFLPPLYPIVAFFYNGLTVSGMHRATWGQRLLDLEVRLYESGTRVPFLNAAAHGVLFYFSTLVAPIFLIALVASEKRCVHDMLAGVIVVRRQG